MTVSVKSEGLKEETPDLASIVGLPSYSTSPLRPWSFQPVQEFVYSQLKQCHVQLPRQTIPSLR